LDSVYDNGLGGGNALDTQTLRQSVEARQGSYSLLTRKNTYGRDGLESFFATIAERQMFRKVSID
jgi:hypothetical protein